MEEKKRIRTDADRRADKKYNEKKIMFSLVYTPTDKEEGLRLKAYLEKSNISTNAYLKSLVKADLDHKGIEYIETENN